MTSTELIFPVRGESLRCNCGYQLAAGLKRKLEELHGAPGANEFVSDSSIGVRLIANPNRVSIPRYFAVREIRLRSSPDRLPLLITLAGKSIRVGGSSLLLGAPYVRALTPSRNLRAWIVTIKGYQDKDHFDAALQRQVQALKLAEKTRVEVRYHQAGEFKGAPMRRVLRIKGCTIVGYAAEAHCDNEPE